LCLHEFGHAVAAFLGGDRSVVGKGYLTLNPVKYTHPLLSIAMPLVFLAMGGIGLPGGAVYIDTGALRNRRWRSVVSASGPAATAIFALILIVPLAIARADWGWHPVFWSGAGALVFLQVTALCLNLLPIPGLDGFGILEPFLPESWMGVVRVVRGYSFLLFFVLLFSNNQLRDAFWQILTQVNNLVNPTAVQVLGGYWFWELGLTLFRFWIPIG
jgi:Zn-dependent protease